MHVENYIKGSSQFQKSQDDENKKSTEPKPLKISKRRWGSGANECNGILPKPVQDMML